MSYKEYEFRIEVCPPKTESLSLRVMNALVALKEAEKEFEHIMYVRCLDINHLNMFMNENQLREFKIKTTTEDLRNGKYNLVRKVCCDWYN